MTSAGPERLAYGVGEAARALGLHPATLYRMIAAGELATLKVRGRTLIRKAELDRVLDEAEAAARAA